MASDRIDSLVRMTSTGRSVLDRVDASFAERHDTPEGQSTIQAMHDITARGGAVCALSNAAKMAASADASRAIVRMASAHEHSAIVQAHDMTVAAGAKCSSGTIPRGLQPMFSAAGLDRARVLELAKMTPLGRRVLEA